MKNFLTNKWTMFALSAATAAVGYLGTVDWNTLEPSYAGGIVSALGMAKMILSALRPATTPAS